MSLENPIFGSREGREEVLSNQTPKEIPRPEKVEESSGFKITDRRAGPEALRQAEEEIAKRKQAMDLEALARRDTFRVVRPESSDTEKHVSGVPDLKIKPEEPPVNIPRPQAREEKPMFTMPQEPKRSFAELKSESMDDYDDLVKSIGETVESIKKKKDAAMAWAFRKSGLRVVGEGARRVAQKAFLVRRMNQYGWWRFGKEKAGEAATEAVVNLMVKGVTAVKDGVTKKDGVMGKFVDRLGDTSKPFEGQRELLATAVKLLEVAQSQGMIKGFKIEQAQ